jgi:hypothetical protein
MLSFMRTVNFVVRSNNITHGKWKGGWAHHQMKLSKRIHLSDKPSFTCQTALFAHDYFLLLPSETKLFVVASATKNFEHILQMLQCVFGSTNNLDDLPSFIKVGQILCQMSNHRRNLTQHHC